MTGQLNNPYSKIFPLLLVLSALSPAMAQQGQYHVTDAPSALPGLTSRSGIATYSPIKTIDGFTIQLRGEDGVTFTFTLDAGTVYCQGDTKVSDWTYLKAKVKKNSITVLTADDAHKNALVIWDRGPSISTPNGSFVFALPPICK
jgi:hypothetical protein